MTRGIVCTPHRAATQAGARVLREGGNAVDAAIAANAVLCVVYPHMTSIGGDLFALVWPPDAPAPLALMGAGPAGSRARIEAVREQGHEVMPPRGALTVTVPGTVVAWGRLLERFGTWGFGGVLEEAAAIARDGWVVTEGLATALSDNFEWLSREAEASRLLPPLKPGMLLRNPELAASLEAVGRHGFLAFYRGAIGEAIVESVRERGGFLELSDLMMMRVVDFVEPVRTSYRHLDVFQCPPPTQGLVTSGMLRRFEAVAEADRVPGPGFAREMLRIRDEVYALRERYIGDPLFVEVPWEPFLNPGADSEGGAPPIPEGDTINLCVADEAGTVVSLTQSVANAFGSGIYAKGTGVLLQNRGVYFSLEGAHVNRLEPGKRTMHTLIPGLAGHAGRPYAAFGCMGADGQPQVSAQVFLNLVEGGMDAQAAVAHPRIRVAPGGGEVWVEADYPGASSLELGRPVVLRPPRNSNFGHAQALVVDGPGRWRGGADPRADGSVETV